MKPIEVLLVEDNAADAFLVRQGLAASPIPVKLHIAQDGMQALLMLSSGAFQPDLVILDLNLPNVSGHDLVELFDPKDVPVVVFSSSQDDDMKRSLALGACDHVQKPTDIHAYSDAVCGIVEKWAVRRERHHTHH